MTPIANSRRDFIIKMASVSGVLAGGAVLSACGGSDGPMVQFNYGVASGDPLADRVILWTHAKYDGFPDAVPLTYQVATDVGFTSIVSTGTATASDSTGYTAKADATGLSAGRDYYFRFFSGRWMSPVGLTRTLPASSVTSVKFAVFSCTLYSAGYSMRMTRPANRVRSTRCTWETIFTNTARIPASSVTAMQWRWAA